MSEHRARNRDFLCRNGSCTKSRAKMGLFVQSRRHTVTNAVNQVVRKARPVTKAVTMRHRPVTNHEGTNVEVEFSSYRATTVAHQQLATKMDELHVNYNRAASRLQRDNCSRSRVYDFFWRATAPQPLHRNDLRLEWPGDRLAPFTTNCTLKRISTQCRRGAGAQRGKTQPNRRSRMARPELAGECLSGD